METNAKVPPKDEYCDGIWVPLDGRREYLVPALNFRALKKHQPRLAAIRAIAGTPSEEQMDVLVEVAHAALVRNYPDLTIDQLDDMIDMKNYPALFMAIAGSSMLEKQVGEALAESP